nr:hypothetical protein EC90111_4240 [Escherichia coli 9.0111]
MKINFLEENINKKEWFFIFESIMTETFPIYTKKKKSSSTHQISK